MNNDHHTNENGYIETGEVVATSTFFLFIMFVIWFLVSWMMSEDTKRTEYIVDTGKQTVVQTDYEVECVFTLGFDDPCTKDKQVFSTTWEGFDNLPQDVEEDIEHVKDRKDGEYPVVTGHNG